ncbi:MAG: helix-hairpin-helix domain-containing protein [Paludibacter sp.]|jgi:hypothetical protein|nr:helix-hairpin-helix domain-containing protein [Paludibacter sp.]
MIFKKLLFIGLIFCVLCNANAQIGDAVPLEQLIGEIFEQYAEDDEEGIDYESFYEELLQLAENPLNLNTAQHDDLQRIPFLSETQIESILYYRYRFGNFNSLYELQLVDGVDNTDIRNLLPFVVTGDADTRKEKLYLREIFKRGKNEILLRADRGVEQKAGYIADNEGNTAYLGDAFYNHLKYRFTYKDRVSVGVVMEKDAGEPFLDKRTVGYDFYSFHAVLNNFGKIKTLAIGDYRVSFGQGLVVSSGFGVRKSSMTTKVISQSGGIKKFSSTAEYDFFRGAATTLRFGKIDFSAFYSNKQIDADTTGGSFSSFYKTGYHRTESELMRKHTVNQQIAGINSTLTLRNFQLGFTAVYTHLDKPLLLNSAPYNMFYFNGKEQVTAGANYRARVGGINFFGETAVTNNWAFATINALSISPVSQVDLVALMRYYSRDYDTFYATAFSENSRPNNETGVYIGAEIHPYKRWKISAYADGFSFQWLKYNTDAPSLGQDYLVQADYTPSRSTTMFLRFKSKTKMQNNSTVQNPTPAVNPLTKNALRYELKYSFGNVSFKNTIEGNAALLGNATWTYGVTALQDVSYRFTTLPLTVDFRYQFFDAENYNNRFTLYEKDVLYAFSIPMFYGKGSRYYFNLKYEAGRRLAVWLKIAQTAYADDRETISSGTEKINGNRKTDFRVVVRYKF